MVPVVRHGAASTPGVYAQTEKNTSDYVVTILHPANDLTLTTASFVKESLREPQRNPHGDLADGVAVPFPYTVPAHANVTIVLTFAPAYCDPEKATGFKSTLTGASFLTPLPGAHS